MNHKPIHATRPVADMPRQFFPCLKSELLAVTFLATVAVIMADRASAAIIIVDPGFDSALTASGGGVDNTETNAWQRNGAEVAPVAWSQTTSIVGPSGLNEGIAKYNDGNEGTSDSRALMQVVTGTGGATGTQILTFDFLMNDADLGNDHDLKLRVEVFGIPTNSWTTGEFNLAMANTNANMVPQDTVAPGPITVLLNSTAFTKTTSATVSASTWQSAIFDINLASGYDQIGIRFTASDGGLKGTLANTIIAIDNVAIIPEPGSALLTGFGLLLISIRRRR